MKFLMTTLMLGAVAGANAQTMPSRDVDTVRSGIGEESLAPVPVKRTLPVVASSTMPAVVGAVGVSSAEVVNDPFTVKNVVVTLSGTTGFDRDAALEQGARQALPGVLVGMGMEPVAAAKTVKGVGSTMNFVKSFKVVKETLIPSYVLTCDLTFNGAMLQKNFGGKIPVKATVVAPVADGTVAPAAPVAQDMPVKQWVVRIVETDPAAVDKVRVNLSSQANTRATYRLLTSSGAELLVDTPLSADDISRVAGRQVEVTALEVPLPAAAVQAVTGAGAWQGRDEPSVPAVPADANTGTY